MACNTDCVSRVIMNKRKFCAPYHVTDNEDPGLPVGQSLLESGPMAHLRSLVVPDLLVVVLEAKNGKGLLLGGELQSGGGGGEVGKQENGNEGETDSGGALNEEQPAPSSDAVGAVQAGGDGSREETAEGTGQNGGGDVDGETLALFLLLVPGREQQQDTGGETGFEDTHDETESDQRLVVGGETHADGDSSPANHDTWAVVSPLILCPF